MFAEILKAVFFGVIEGVTEWLPVSSTGHMLLADEFLTLNMSDSFKEVFFILIQLGAISAVMLLFFRRMMPVELNRGVRIKEHTVSLWLKVALACVPGAVVTLAFDDYIEAHLHTPTVISAALIFYGLAFVFVEEKIKNKPTKTDMLEEISYREALIIGAFQVLSVVPGTSRSGATVIGALLIGVSRVAAAEFTFFLAVPVMLGMSAVKLIGFGFDFTYGEIAVLISGVITAFAVSFACVKLLINYVKRKNFKPFGYYRIALGILILIFFECVDKFN